MLFIFLNGKHEDQPVDLGGPFFFLTMGLLQFEWI